MDESIEAQVVDLAQRIQAEAAKRKMQATAGDCLVTAGNALLAVMLAGEKKPKK
jgi:hypothetical protein